MQNYKICSLPDDYQKVVWKDLEEYLRKDDLLAGYSSIEQQKIRQNLGINFDFSIDTVIDNKSSNPVSNKAIYKALAEKVDTDSITKVALTGDFDDLSNKPCHLPNPELLIINEGEKQTPYDGSESAIISIPTKMSDLTTDLGTVIMIGVITDGTDINTYVSAHVSDAGVYVYDPTTVKLYVTSKATNVTVSEVAWSTKHLYVDTVNNIIYRYAGTLIKLG